MGQGMALLRPAALLHGVVVLMTHNPSLPKVQTRKEFMNYLGNEISSPRYDDESSAQGRVRELKAYVIEANGGIPQSGGSPYARWEMIDTGIDKMKIMRTRIGDTTCEFYADVSDKRFHTLHTTAESDDARRAVAAITDMDGLPLDRMWLSDSLLKALARKSGNSAFRGFAVRYASDFLEENRPRNLEDLDLHINGSMAEEICGHMEQNPHLAGKIAYGKIRLMHGDEKNSDDYVHDDIDKEGCFAVKRGKSIHDHLYLVDSAKELYAKTIEGIEECRLGSSCHNGDMVIGGEPLHFNFKEPLQDTHRFIRRLFDSTRPFRLWGLESEVDDDYYTVAGLDLHTWDPINFEIGANMMRVYLSENNCGNTVMRLLCNLQDRFGTLIKCKQVEQLVR